jgi:MFS family permease
MSRAFAKASSTSGLIPSLPRPVWVLIGLHAVAGLGIGLVLAFLVVYLHFVRGISLGWAGIALAALPLGAMVMGPVAGGLTDRFGPRNVIAACGVIAAASAACLAFVTDEWQAVLVAFAIGVGMTAFESPFYTLLATSVSREQRSAVFAADYAVVAFGWGAGGFVGGMVVHISSVASFQVAFFVATGAFLVFAAAVVASGLSTAGDRVIEDEPAEDTGPNDEPAEDTGPGGYRSVLADRRMRRIMVLSVLLIAFAYVQFDVTFPAVAIGDAHVGTRVIGICFMANMLTVAGGQLFMLRYLQGRRRTRAMVSMFIFAAAGWSLILIAAHIGNWLPTVAILVLSFIVVGFGEMTWSPSVPGMVNDLAPANLRGRYNAGNSFAEQAGRLIGPVIAGFMLERGLNDLWLVIIVLALLAAVPIVFSLERLVPDRANRIGAGAARAVGTQL